MLEIEEFLQTQIHPFYEFEILATKAAGKKNARHYDTLSVITSKMEMVFICFCTRSLQIF